MLSGGPGWLADSLPPPAWRLACLAEMHCRPCRGVGTRESCLTISEQWLSGQTAHCFAPAQQPMAAPVPAHSPPPCLMLTPAPPSLPLLPPIRSLRGIEAKQARFGLVECINHGLLDAYAVSYEKEGEVIAHVSGTGVVLGVCSMLGVWAGVRFWEWVLGCM